MRLFKGLCGSPAGRRRERRFRYGIPSPPGPDISRPHFFGTLCLMSVRPVRRGERKLPPFPAGAMHHPTPHLPRRGPRGREAHGGRRHGRLQSMKTFQRPTGVGSRGSRSYGTRVRTSAYVAVSAQPKVRLRRTPLFDQACPLLSHGAIAIDPPSFLRPGPASRRGVHTADRGVIPAGSPPTVRRDGAGGRRDRRCRHRRLRAR